MPRYLIKTFDIKETEPGMQIAKMILTNTGQLALDVGTILTESLIDILKGWGINQIEVLLTFPDDDSALESIVELSTVKATQKIQTFCANYTSTVDEINQFFSATRLLEEVPIKELCRLAEGSIEELVDASGVVNHLHMVKRQDDYTFHHSVNVSIIAGVLGKWLGYTGNELRDLVLAGLLHDIGKTQIPLEILNKPGRLTDNEMEIMRQHTTLGYRLVSKLYVPLGVMYGVLQHHERSDGSGYPLKLTDKKIHEYAKIIAIADIYDAMTSDRVYKPKVSPFSVVEMIMKEMYDKLDPIICMVFLNNVRDYLVGNIILLSTGEEAEVVYMGPFTAARPVVRTVDGMFIDLETHKDISIVKMVKT